MTDSTPDEGVAAGSTATAGAPVSPVQTTVHADLSVSGVTDDMVEAGLQAVVALGCDDGCDPDCSCRETDDKDRADFQLFVRTALEGALAGCTVVELPTLDADCDCRIGEELDAGAVGVINRDDGTYEVGLYLDGVGFGLKPARARRIAAAILAAVARGDERIAAERETLTAP